jgi:Zn-dependent metalloprotease
MARTGNEAARLSTLQDQQTRATRSGQIADMAVLSGVMAPLPGTAGRAVYTCNNLWVQQVQLVRGEGDPLTADDATNDTYDAGGTVRSYYKEVLNRNSIDNLGLNQIHNVHFGVNYMNAFWDGSQMTYGDGDGTIFVDFTKDLDVVAHELTHGVTQYTAGLQYFSQSGALNESFSDVFASVIQQAANGQTADNADWLIGNGIMGPSLYGEALRSMKAPGTAYDNPIMGKDPQPDHMSNYYAGPADNQGVHINSGIPNKAFYLVAMDIGTDKAALIWYTALQKLWWNAVFSDAVAVIAEAARLLTKNREAPYGSTQTVRSAFKEVGLY